VDGQASDGTFYEGGPVNAEIQRTGYSVEKKLIVSEHKGNAESENNVEAVGVVDQYVREILPR